MARRRQVPPTTKVSLRRLGRHRFRGTAVSAPLPDPSAPSPELLGLMINRLVQPFSQAECMKCKRRRLAFGAFPDRVPAVPGEAVSYRILDALRHTLANLCERCLEQALGVKDGSIATRLLEMQDSNLVGREGRCGRCGSFATVYRVGRVVSEPRSRLISKPLLLCLYLGLTGIAAAALLLGVHYLETRIWRPSALVFAVPAYLAYTIFVPLSVLWTGNEKTRLVFDPVAVAEHFFVIPLGYLISFYLIVRALWMFLGTTPFGALPPEVSELTWLWYVVDNLVRVLLLDWAEVYGVSVSGVDHSRVWWMSTLVFSFRFALSMGIVKLFLRGYWIYRSPAWRAGWSDYEVRYRSSAESRGRFRLP